MVAAPVVIGLLLRLLLDARLASTLLGGPWLLEVCERESNCPIGLVGVHDGDRWMASRLGDGWSTRGAHGHVAAFAWPYVPRWLRIHPAVLDVPLLSAWVSVRRARHWRCSAVPACRRWRGW